MRVVGILTRSKVRAGRAGVVRVRPRLSQGACVQSAAICLQLSICLDTQWVWHSALARTDARRVHCYLECMGQGPRSVCVCAGPGRAGSGRSEEREGGRDLSRSVCAEFGGGRVVPDRKSCDGHVPIFLRVITILRSLQYVIIAGSSTFHIHRTI